MEKFLNGQHVRWIHKDGYSRHGRYVQKKIKWFRTYHIIFDETDNKFIYMSNSDVENLIEWYDKDYVKLKPLIVL